MHKLTTSGQAEPNLKKPRNWLALGGGLITTVLFSVAFPLSKQALVDAHPLTLAGLRFLGGSLCIIIFALILARSKLRKTFQLKIRLSVSLVCQLLGIGFLQFFISFGTLFWGLEYLNSTTASLLANLVPLPALLLGWMFLSERPHLWQGLGVLVALIGILLFFGAFTGGVTAIYPWGVVILSGTCAFAGGSVWSSKLLKTKKGRNGDVIPPQINRLTLTAWALGFGGAISLVVSWLFGAFLPSIPLGGLPQVSLHFILFVALLALFCTALAYSLYNYANSKLPAFLLPTLLTLVPLETALISWVFTRGTIQLFQLFGMLLVLVGMALVVVVASSTKT